MHIFDILKCLTRDLEYDKRYVLLVQFKNSILQSVLLLLNKTIGIKTVMGFTVGISKC